MKNIKYYIVAFVVCFITISKNVHADDFQNTNLVIYDWMKNNPLCVAGGKFIPPPRVDIDGPATKTAAKFDLYDASVSPDGDMIIGFGKINIITSDLKWYKAIVKKALDRTVVKRIYVSSNKKFVNNNPDDKEDPKNIMCE